MSNLRIRIGVVWWSWILDYNLLPWWSLDRRRSGPTTFNRYLNTPFIFVRSKSLRHDELFTHRCDGKMTEHNNQERLGSNKMNCNEIWRLRFALREEKNNDTDCVNAFNFVLFIQHARSNTNDFISSCLLIANQLVNLLILFAFFLTFSFRN